MSDATDTVSKQFADMFIPAELHPDLVPYLGELSSGMQSLRHPLVYGVPYCAETNNHYNKLYEHKKGRFAVGGGKGRVAFRNVSKSDVFACLLGRNEQEIILLPGECRR